MSEDQSFPPPENSTAIAVAIGQLQVQVQEGFKGVRESIDALTRASIDHGDRIGKVETKTEVTEARVDNIQKTLDDTKPEKGRGLAWGALAVAIVATASSIMQWLLNVGH